LIFFYIFCEGFINAVEARSWLPHQLAGEISAACMHIYTYILIGPGLLYPWLMNFWPFMRSQKKNAENFVEISEI